MIGPDRRGTPLDVRRSARLVGAILALSLGLSLGTGAPALAFADDRLAPVPAPTGDRPPVQTDAPGDAAAPPPAAPIGPATPPAADGTDGTDDTDDTDDTPDDDADEPEDFDDPDDRPSTKPARPSAFALPAARRTDPYGPRPSGVPKLSREQIIRFALDNPAVAAAEDEVDAMKAQLARARYLWVPQIDTLTTLSPGVNVRCDDVLLDNGNDGFEFQFCRASDDPDLDVNTVKGYFQQLSRAGVRVAFSADAVVPIFTFGKIKNAKALARVGVALKQLEKAATKAETMLLVERGWVALLAAREGQAILREAQRVLERARGRVEKDLGGSEDDWDVDPGSANPDRDPDDLIKIQLAENQLEARMREALKVEAVALAALWALAGKAAPPGFDAKADRLAADPVDGGLRPLEEYRSIARVQRPEAKMATAAVQARAAQARLARSSLLPDFGIALGVGLARSTSADRDMSQLYYQDGFNYSRFTAALAMRWKWDLGLVFDLRRARAQLRAAEHTEDAARILLGHEVEKAYLDVMETEQLIDLSVEATELSWRLVISQEQKDTVGGGDAEKLLRALERWYTNRFSQVEAIHDHNRALAELSRAVGTPLVAPRKAPAPEGAPGAAPAHRHLSERSASP